MEGCGCDGRPAIAHHRLRADAREWQLTGRDTIPGVTTRDVCQIDESWIYFLQQESSFTPRSSRGGTMTHAMHSASLASALEASAVDREAIGDVVAVNGEIASVDGFDDLIETIPR